MSNKKVWVVIEGTKYEDSSIVCVCGTDDIAIAKTNEHATADMNNNYYKQSAPGYWLSRDGNNYILVVDDVSFFE